MRRMNRATRTMTKTTTTTTAMMAAIAVTAGNTVISSRVNSLICFFYLHVAPGCLGITILRACDATLFHHR